MTHYLRSRHDAIMVGIGTAKADNPGLNTRYSEDGNEIVGMDSQPRPFVLDPGGRWRVEDTPKLFSLAETGEGRAPWWVVGHGGEGLDEGLVERIEGFGGGVCDAGQYGNREDGVDWDTILRNMSKTGIRSVMIEGGGTVRILGEPSNSQEANYMGRSSKIYCENGTRNTSVALSSPLHPHILGLEAWISLRRGRPKAKMKSIS